MLVSAARATSSRSIALRARSFASVVDAAGFKVAATDNGQPTASVTLLVKAGSRYETKAGLAHALKNFGFKNTAERSALGTVREAEYYGGVLSSALTREHISYTAEFLRGDESYFVDVLSSILNSTRFTRYELEETVLPAVEAEATAARADPATHAVELAHALAFRSGLGDTLFAQPHSHIKIEDVKEYAASVFGRGNVAILGTGISQEVLSRLVEKHLSSTPAASVTAKPTNKYYGGETRVPFAEHEGHALHTAFVGYGIPGQPSADLAVLATHLSPTSSVKWSVGTSPLSGTLPTGTSAQTVLLQYSDATLFGLLVQGKTPESVTEAGKLAVKALKDVSAPGVVQAEDLKKAAAKAKFLAASAADGREGLVSTFGPSLLSGSQTSLDSVFASVDKVDMSSLRKTASELVKSKPTFVAVGDTYRLPHPDELGL
ncbi:Metalloenzyme, LuxS/M16 peptidase-like protein [Hysterangium stoloniferum]|nr:Metalloenzyme, LuxS/M16 peptidase-like protein [Hysterangium stoloniferum]